MKNSFYQLSFAELSLELEKQSLTLSGANQLFNWHYKKKELSPCRDNLALATQAFIEKQFHFQLPAIVEIQESPDSTIKFLLELSDGAKIEMVLIAFINKYTLCLSTQVGCAMKCSFCYTGTMGLKRHLKTEEIIGQFIVASRFLIDKNISDRPLKNIVFMGQGEPLHNFDAVKKACDILIDQHGASVGWQKITISTAGYLPGLERWVKEGLKVNLALSLHAVEDQLRNQLIPINQQYPLKEVLAAIAKIPLARKQVITYEYLLIDNFNDQPEDALKLANLLTQQVAIVNLIPFNPFPGSKYQRPSLGKLEVFKSILESHKIPTLIRSTKGDEILAACGQLNSKVR